MAVKYGDFISAKLAPQWGSKTKAGNDASGWKRGARGIDGKYDADGKLWMRDYDPAASDLMYGRRGDRPNGQQVVQTKSRFPSDLADSFKGSKGIDAGEPDHDDDGAR